MWHSAVTARQSSVAATCLPNEASPIECEGLPRQSTTLRSLARRMTGYLPSRAGVAAALATAAAVAAAVAAAAALAAAATATAVSVAAAATALAAAAAALAAAAAAAPS